MEHEINTRRLVIEVLTFHFVSAQQKYKIISLTPYELPTKLELALKFPSNIQMFAFLSP